MEQITKRVTIQQPILTSLGQPLPSQSSVSLQHNNKASKRKYQIWIEAICVMLDWVVCHFNGLVFTIQEKMERSYLKVTFSTLHSRSNNTHTHTHTKCLYWSFGTIRRYRLGLVYSGIRLWTVPHLRGPRLPWDKILCSCV